MPRCSCHTLRRDEQTESLVVAGRNTCQRLEGRGVAVCVCSRGEPRAVVPHRHPPLRLLSHHPHAYPSLSLPRVRPLRACTNHPQTGRAAVHPPSRPLVYVIPRFLYGSKRRGRSEGPSPIDIIVVAQRVITSQGLTRLEARGGEWWMKMMMVMTFFPLSLAYILHSL